MDGWIEKHVICIVIIIIPKPCYSTFSYFYVQTITQRIKLCVYILPYYPNVWCGMTQAFQILNPTYTFLSVHIDILHVKMWKSLHTTQNTLATTQNTSFGLGLDICIYLNMFVLLNDSF